MAHILLVAVNSSFSHTNIAVRYLKYYSGRNDVDFAEWTINQPMGEIIRGINSYNPGVVLFSTYIWNVETVERIAKNLKALRPEVIIGAGGPEAGFRGTDFLKANPDFDLVMKGEGEAVFAELAEKLVERGQTPKIPENERGQTPAGFLLDVKGLFLRKPGSPEEILFTGDHELICDLGTIPFPYPDLEQMDPDHKIYYYESSRGCPFSCAYCMSSLDTKVRFVPLEKVYADLQRFLDAGVKLVKFVDRTYNLKPERYISIWKYIMEHHNGKTMFHFEIEGEFLSEEAMEFLQTVPEGIMQFEIGVQSSNPAVLKACGRSPETLTLRQNILRIPKTIHTHLDLIAGLPYEDLESFGRSFDFVMDMEPDALQLGFLKILYGAPVNAFCGEPGWKWMKTPPYEVLETPFLSYEEILFLKDLETALDAYWNSHNFDKVTSYLSKKCFSSWWSFFVELTKWLRSVHAFDDARQKDYWAQKLFEYLCSEGTDPSKQQIAIELLRFDYIASGKKTNPPAWLKRNWDKDGHYAALQKTTGINNSRLDFAYSDFDSFEADPLAENPGENGDGRTYHILFLYPRRDSDNPTLEQKKARQLLVD